MYVVRVEAVKTAVKHGNLRGLMRGLKLWFAVRKLHEYGRARYYLVADEESLAMLKDVFEALGYSIKAEKLEPVPWYFAELAATLVSEARDLAVKRRAINLFAPVFRGEKSVREIARELAAKYNISDKGEFEKFYRKLLRIKKSLTSSVFVEFFPRTSPEEFVKHAVRVGFVPITRTLYYSGKFYTETTAYDRTLLKLEGTPYTELNKKLEEVVKAEYGINAGDVLKALKKTKAFQELVVRSRARELADQGLKFDYNIFILRG